MLKKSLLVLLVLSTTKAYSLGAPYIGLKVGVNSASYQLRNSGLATNYSSNGETGGGIIGFGGDLQDNFYLSAELFAEAGSIYTSYKTINPLGVTAKIRSQWAVGVSLLPGFRMNEDATLFLRIGGVRGYFGLTQKNLAGSRSDVNTAANGVQVGIGMQLSLSESVAVRGEYIYTNYYSFKEFGSNVTSRNNQVAVSFLYRFL